MAIQTVEEELKSLLQWNEFPTLTQDEIDTLLFNAKSSDYLGILPDDYEDWVPSIVYAVDDVVVPVERNGHYYIVTTGGTSGVTEPDWPIAGAVVDGTVTWGEAGATFWTPSWNLNSAAYKGWRLKAAKVANRYDQSTDITTLRRSQLFRMCLDMAKMFGSSAGMSIQVQGGFGSTIYSSPIIGNVNSG